MTGDPASYKHFLMQGLNMLAPPISPEEQEKQKKEKAAKEAEESKIPGTLTLGKHMMKKLGVGEEKVLET